MNYKFKRSQGKATEGLVQRKVWRYWGLTNIASASLYCTSLPAGRYKFGL